MRNRTATNDDKSKNGGYGYRCPPLSFDMFEFVPCQEKPNNESLAILYRHTAVSVQIVLEIGESSLYLVVGVRHSRAIFALKREEVGQVEIHAVHGGTQPLMGVPTGAGSFRHGATIDNVGISLFPLFVDSLKGGLVCTGN